MLVEGKGMGMVGWVGWRVVAGGEKKEPWNAATWLKNQVFCAVKCRQLWGGARPGFDNAILSSQDPPLSGEKKGRYGRNRV